MTSRGSLTRQGIEDADDRQLHILMPFFRHRCIGIIGCGVDGSICNCAQYDGTVAEGRAFRVILAHGNSLGYI